MFSLTRCLRAGIALLALTTLAVAGEPVASRAPRSVAAETVDSCRALIGLTRQTYRTQAPVRLTRMEIDSSAGSIRLTIAGLSRPVAVRYADPVNFASMDDYAEYMRDRIGPASFESWTGATELDNAETMAGKLAAAQRSAIAELAARAVAGTAEIVLHDSRSIWSPETGGRETFQLTLYDRAANGCVDHALGGEIERDSIDPDLMQRVTAGAQS